MPRLPGRPPHCRRISRSGSPPLRPTVAGDICRCHRATRDFALRRPDSGGERERRSRICWSIPRCGAAPPLGDRGRSSGVRDSWDDHGFGLQVKTLRTSLVTCLKQHLTRRFGMLFGERRTNKNKQSVFLSQLHASNSFRMHACW
jgi:hypothetical protein